MDDLQSDLSRMLGPEYLADLPARSTDEVRALRAECQDVETGLSYLRRVIQGRLDIVDAELARRRDGGEPGDLASLIDQLPEILADHLRAPGMGRLTSTLGPGRIDAALEAELDRLVADANLDAIGDAADDNLTAAREGLARLEHEVSARRRALFDRIDALQAELTRRYKTGEASVETLLR